MASTKFYSSRSQVARLNLAVRKLAPSLRAEAVASISPEELRNNTAEAQRQRLLRALSDARLDGITTAEARELLNIVHAPARVLELRKLGHKLVAAWVLQTDAFGYEHRTRHYHLAASSEAA